MRMIRKGIVTGVFGLAVVGCSAGPTFWTDEVVEQLRIEHAVGARLDVRTHNGAITLRGRNQDGSDSSAVIQVRRSAGGRTPEEADAAMKALEVFCKEAGESRYDIGWRWTEPKRPDWGARVSFEIDAPQAVTLAGVTHNGSIVVRHVSGPVDARTHNGGITIEAVAGDVRAVTHNGSVRAESAGDVTSIETHNGHVTGTFRGKRLDVVTHNGGVQLNLDECGSLSGSIATHNGSITLSVGPRASAELTCNTYNGTIRSDAPLTVREVSRRTLRGRLGDGGSPLSATTHNGSIHLHRAGSSSADFVEPH
jgi:hypothetical protein